MSKPFLFALQVYHADIEQAVHLSKLLAQLNGDRLEHPLADAMVVYRRDCPANKRLEENLEEAFGRVLVYRTSRREVGFPGGPNGMWCDLMQHLATSQRHGHMTHEVVLTTEADALPLCKDWVEVLLAAWRKEKVQVAGHRLPNGEHDCGHINGNALFAPTISAKEMRLVGCPAQSAWDTYFAQIFERLGWADIPEIRSIYRKTMITPAELEDVRSQGCVWLHGVKDNSALDWAKTNAEKKFVELPTG